MARSSQRRSRRDAKQWSEILKRFEASGHGARSFCHQEGVSPSSLQRWRKRLGQGAAGRFVELVPESPITPSPREWTFELELPHGIVLRMRA